VIHGQLLPVQVDGDGKEGRNRHSSQASSLWICVVQERLIGMVHYGMVQGASAIEHSVSNCRQAFNAHAPVRIINISLYLDLMAEKGRYYSA